MSETESPKNNWVWGITFILLIAKLFGANITWFWVFFPVLLSLGITLAILAVVLVIGFIAWIVGG